MSYSSSVATGTAFVHKREAQATVGVSACVHSSALLKMHRWLLASSKAEQPPPCVHCICSLTPLPVPASSAQNPIRQSSPVYWPQPPQPSWPNTGALLSLVTHTPLGSTVQTSPDRLMLNVQLDTQNGKKKTLSTFQAPPRLPALPPAASRVVGGWWSSGWPGIGGVVWCGACVF
jgi:hypothetical protein